MSSHPHDLFENRQQFQLERMILFSDAVFAIAITLLVIEIKIPEAWPPTEAKLVAGLKHILPDVIGFVMSFAIIGQFWITHHRMFGYVQRFDTGLLWLNLHLLFWVAIMPFTSEVNMHYGNVDFAWMIYSINMAMIGFGTYFLWRRIVNPKRNLSAVALDAHFRKYALTRSLVTSLIFLTGFILCLFEYEPISIAARFIFILIVPAIRIINKRFKIKKATGGVASKIFYPVF
ncbi:MAG: hypothetical protein JWN76_932 [Chitinophagaceae bacterium]|nr:hypothetical protein [Chitinophagaceae bacterium]